MAGMPRGLESRRTWRPDLAYAVGLITTDGNLSPDGRHITLVSRDLELLETFKHILQLRVRVAHHAGGYSTAYHVVFSDRLFHEWLSSIGLTPRKTHSIGALCIPDDVFPDFARGHLDGDGSITRYVDRYNTKLEPSDVYQRLYTRFLSASRPHMEWFRARVAALLGVRGYMATDRRTPDRVPLYRLHFAKKESVALLRWMYYAPDVPCLTRKRTIAEPFLTGTLRDFRYPAGLESAIRRGDGSPGTGPP